MRRDDYLVGLVLGERVTEGVNGIRIDDGASGRDPGLVEEIERPAEAALRGGTAAVLVDDEPGSRVVLRGDDSHPDRPFGGPLAQRVDERPARDGLVREHEDVPRPPRRIGPGGHQWWIAPTDSASFAVVVGSPPRTACRAPGVPYSYGLPTTGGIPSKLKIGGGEDTCHSSVSARHGFPGASGPLRQLTIML